MLLVYENRNTGVSAEWKKPVHVPPHLHEAIEVVYVTDGEIELGVGQELLSVPVLPVCMRQLSEKQLKEPD